jgi:hypothetical protein
MSIEIFIPGNVPSSKNGRVWTGKYFVASKATQKYWRASKQDWIDNREAFVNAVQDMPKPYKIRFKFIRNSVRLFDYVNPLQTILDLMVEHKWLEDDNADVIIPKFMPYEIDYLQPGVIITV